MSLEYAPQHRVSQRAAYTTNNFCESYGLSRLQLYKLWRQGIGPRFFYVGSRRLITVEAGQQWAREREAAACGGIKETID